MATLRERVVAAVRPAAPASRGHRVLAALGLAVALGFVSFRLQHAGAPLASPPKTWTPQPFGSSLPPVPGAMPATVPPGVVTPTPTPTPAWLDQVARRRQPNSGIPEYVPPPRLPIEFSADDAQAFKVALQRRLTETPAKSAEAQVLRVGIASAEEELVACRKVANARKLPSSGTGSSLVAYWRHAECEKIEKQRAAESRRLRPALEAAFALLCRPTP